MMEKRTFSILPISTSTRGCCCCCSFCCCCSSQFVYNYVAYKHKQSARLTIRNLGRQLIDGKWKFACTIFPNSANLIGWIAINLWSPPRCLLRADVRSTRPSSFPYFVVILCRNVRRDFLFFWRSPKYWIVFQTHPPHVERANFNTSLSTVFSSSSLLPRSRYVLQHFSPLLPLFASVPDEVLKCTGGCSSDPIQMLPQKYKHTCTNIYVSIYRCAHYNEHCIWIFCNIAMIISHIWNYLRFSIAICITIWQTEVAKLIKQIFLRNQIHLFTYKSILCWPSTQSHSSLYICDWLVSYSLHMCIHFNVVNPLTRTFQLFICVLCIFKKQRKWLS